MRHAEDFDPVVVRSTYREPAKAKRDPVPVIAAACFAAIGITIITAAIVAGRGQEAAQAAVGIPLLLIFSVGGLAIYFLPTIIALGRGVGSVGPLVIVNLFLGWTFLGWVVALAWSFAPVKSS